MKKNIFLVIFGFVCLSLQLPAQQSSLHLNDKEYFEMQGLNVMVFQDIYPEGHQGGLGIIQNGVRVATNGDLRLESTPGQWSPRYSTHSSRFSGNEGFSLPVAAGRVCSRGRIFQFYVFGSCCG